MKKNLVLSSVMVACAFAGTWGCDVQDEETKIEDRQVVFEGGEVKAALEQEPNTIFFVDLRERQTYYFEQGDVALDMSKFIVQCPSMDYPIPMADFATMLELDTEAPSWALRTGADAFRGGTFPEDQEDLECTLSCSGGTDCVWWCE